MQPPLKSLKICLFTIFSIDNSCKSVSHKNQKGESGGAEGMLACPAPLKQNRKQQLSDKRASTLQQLSLSLLSGIYRLFSLAETTNSTFLCRLWRNWITPSTRTGLSEGRQHLLSTGPGGLSHHWSCPMITCAKVIMLFTHAYTQNRWLLHTQAQAPSTHTH